MQPQPHEFASRVSLSQGVAPWLRLTQSYKKDLITIESPFSSDQSKRTLTLHGSRVLLSQSSSAANRQIIRQQPLVKSF